MNMSKDFQHFWNFREYSLTNDDYLKAAAFMAGFWCFIFFVGKIAFKKDTKKLAWVISFTNSLILSIVGAFYVYNMTVQLPQFQNFGPNGKAVFEKYDNVSCLICLWMIAANIADIFFSMFFYSTEFGMLTGWIHHTVYILSPYGFLTGNGGFFKAPSHAGGFSLCMVEEIPTFLLALGSMFPAFRTDLGFGMTFFILRILYHGYILIYQIYFKVHMFPVTITGLSMMLHLFWFKGWATKYGRKLFSGGNNSAGKDKKQTKKID